MYRLVQTYADLHRHAQYWALGIVLRTLPTKGKGVKKYKNAAYAVYGWSLTPRMKEWDKGPIL